MKLLCLLLSISIGYVWTCPEMKLLREIVITNELIKQAYDMNDFFIGEKFIANGLEHIIKSVILKQKRSLNYINHMFVVPDLLYDDDLPASTRLQRRLKYTITFGLNIESPKVPLKNFTDLDFVDLGEERRSLTRKALRKIIMKEIGYERKVPIVEEPSASELFKKRKVLVTSKLNDKFNTLNMYNATGHSSFYPNVAPANEKSELIEEGYGDFDIIEHNECQDDEKSVPTSDGDSKVFGRPSFNDKFGTSSLYGTTGYNSFDLNESQAIDMSEVNEEEYGDSRNESKLPSVNERNISNPFKKRKDFGISSICDNFGALSIYKIIGRNNLELSVSSEKDTSLSNDDEDKQFHLIELDEFQDDEMSEPPTIEQIEINENYIDQDGGPPSNRHKPEVPIQSLCTFIGLFLNTNCPNAYLDAWTDPGGRIVCNIQKKINMDAEPELFSFSKVNGTWDQELKMQLDHE